MSQTMNSAPKNVPEQRTYKVEDIAVMLNIGRTSAYSLVKEGHFKIVRGGNAIRISKKSRSNLERKIEYGIYYQT